MHSVGRFIFCMLNCLGIHLGWANQDLWGLPAESRCIVASYSLVKMIPNAMGESFWLKLSLLKYTMAMLQGPKDPALPILSYIAVT